MVSVWLVLTRWLQSRGGAEKRRSDRRLEEEEPKRGVEIEKAQQRQSDLILLRVGWIGSDLNRTDRLVQWLQSLHMVPWWCGRNLLFRSQPFTFFCTNHNGEIFYAQISLKINGLDGITDLCYSFQITADLFSVCYSRTIYISRADSFSFAL